jgi:hypothetical protein
MTETRVVHSHPAYVRGLCIMQNMYVHGLGIEQARTLLKIFKKEKDSDRALNSGNLVSTCKVTRDPKRLRILQQTGIQAKQRSPKNTLERLPSGVANSAMGKIPLIWV